MSAKRHVLTVVTRFEAGAGLVALRGAQALDSDRFQITVAAGSGDKLLEEAASSGFAIRPLTHLVPQIAPRQDLRAVAELEALLARGPADVVHTHSAKAGAVGRLAARRAGVRRVVHTYHGFPFHEFQSPARRAAYVGIERRLGKITDVGLCVGTAVAVEAIRRHLLPPERIRTIGVTTTPISSSTSQQLRLQARAELGIPLSCQVVGCVGRLAYQKAPEHFVAALARLNRPNVVGVWIGDGEMAEPLRRTIARMGPTCHILLAGHRSDVAALLPAFDVFALPSRYEGLPVAVVEAMIAGVPVVATAVNAVSDAVVPGVTGLLVPPQQPELLAGAIAHLLDHPQQAAQLALRARARLQGQHSQQELGHSLAAAYAPDTETAHWAGPMSGFAVEPNQKEQACV